MTIQVKKSFNIRSKYGQNRFGFGVYGINTRIYGHSSTVPEIIPYINVTTPSATIHKDEPSIDIDFTTLNVETLLVKYKVNDDTYQTRDEISYTENPYTFIFTGMGLEDNDVVTILLCNKDNTDIFDTVEFTMEEPQLAIITTGGEIEDEGIINIEYTYNDVESINIYYNKNSSGETLFESDVPTTGLYALDTTALMLADDDILQVIIKDSSDETLNDDVTFTIIQPSILITSVGGEVNYNDSLLIEYLYNDVDTIDVIYTINGGPEVVYESNVPADGSYVFDASTIEFSHEDQLKVIIRDSVLTHAEDDIDYTIIVSTIVIDSINNGLPLTYEGVFEDGMWYFADSTGTKIVDKNDETVSIWFIGTGTVDGDIDLDIKMLAITDVVVPEAVQLGVAFDVSGNYVMIEDKIVIEGYNDDSSTWVKLHVGDYIEVADGSFTESVTLESAGGFAANTSVTIRVRSYDGYALNGSDSTDVIATVTMNAISGMVGETPYTLEGTTDGDAVEIWVDDGTGYAYEGDAVVVGSAWSYDITLAVGTYDIKAIDGTDSRGYAEQTGVDILVASYVKILSILDDGIFVEIQNKKTII